MTPDELIAKYLEPDPAKPWLAEYRVKNHGTHVWALIGHLNSVDWDIEETAGDYYLTKEQVEAAIAFYKRHTAHIKARLAENSDSAA